MRDRSFTKYNFQFNIDSDIKRERDSTCMGVNRVVYLRGNILHIKEKRNKFIQLE